MSDKLQYKIIQGGLLPPVPSLPQSKTLLIRGISGHSDNYSEMESILSVDTSNVDEDNETDSDTSTSSDSSSDWDARTIISTVSTVLPPRQKTHQKMEIKPYFSQQVLINFKKDPQIDITYDLYELFYPYTNLQSLLFSQLHPYIETDYKKNKAFGNTNDETKYNDTPKHNVKMNWDDTVSINRITGLINKLLSSSGSNQGIKEDEFYLMFSSPSPNEIIEALRFGSLSNLCDVHIDRFGRRTYHYQHNTITGHKRRQSKLHFYNHSRCPSSMFGDGDIVGLSDFIEEDVKSEISNHCRNISRPNVAKIHYHDNDVVMVSSPRNGKMETEVRWQNFAIHSYLYNKTRLSMQSISESISYQKKRKSLAKKRRQNNAFKNPIYSINTRARAIGQYGHSMIPHMFKPRQSPGLISNNTSPNIIIKKIKKPQEKQKRAMTKLNNKVKKEGFLEKENIRGIAKIVSKQWIAYWCLLKNKQMFLYKSREIRYKKQKMLQKAVECIDLNKIGVPISTGYDTVSKYFTFKLDVVNGGQYYMFRTRSEYERNCWLTEIDSMLDYQHNIGQVKKKKGVEIGKRNDKTENCLIM